jgi:hypothetical protein
LIATPRLFHFHCHTLHFQRHYAIFLIFNMIRFFAILYFHYGLQYFHAIFAFHLMPLLAHDAERLLLSAIAPLTLADTPPLPCRRFRRQAFSPPLPMPLTPLLFATPPLLPLRFTLCLRRDAITLSAAAALMPIFIFAAAAADAR